MRRTLAELAAAAALSPLALVGLPLAAGGAPGAAAAPPVLAPASPPIPGAHVAAYAHAAGFRGYALAVAVAVAGAESGWSPDALGDDHPIGGLRCPSHGLWQIRSCPGVPGGLDRGTRDQLVDPAHNAQVAYRLWITPRSFGHWSVFTDGRYLTWLDRALAVTAPLAIGDTPAERPGRPASEPGDRPEPGDESGERRP
jgi:hypothetical protein